MYDIFFLGIVIVLHSLAGANKDYKEKGNWYYTQNMIAWYIGNMSLTILQQRRGKCNNQG